VSKPESSVPSSVQLTDGPAQTMSPEEFNSLVEQFKADPVSELPPALLEFLQQFVANADR